MPHDGTENTAEPKILPDLATLASDAVDGICTLLETAKEHVRDLVSEDGQVIAALLDHHQDSVHALAWLATYVEALREMLGWAERLRDLDQFGETEKLILQIAFSEYLSQIQGGIPISQSEIVRPWDVGLSQDETDALSRAAAAKLIRFGNTQPVRMRLVELMINHSGHATVGGCGLDEELDMIREQFRRFADERIVPHAHQWHLNDELIPIGIVRELSDMGVFGLTIPEEHGGSGLTKTSMVVVSEELSRGYIGVGSLGTRSEIAAELILCGGTQEQKSKWLPRIASGETLPTAVFTEPDTGSDLGALRTRAAKTESGYRITGNKTWITHAARANLMTVLARTNPDSSDYRGLSMFLAEKPAGTDGRPFPVRGITGSEIAVLGYRGMKEYELGFDGFDVSDKALLGRIEGQGFRQLMRTFECARIQTAARAVGVAQAALETGMNYAMERRQFGKTLISFPRVAGKLAMMATEIMVARQLTYFSARKKDEDRRCDLEAGMAKLLGARVAWACADNTLQIHGGNGFALEYEASRLLCDARILNIFEGAAEIQAQVIARRLLERSA